jgi:hypothetical protein
MQVFENDIKLRGFLGKDAETPSSDHIRMDSFAVLLLVTVSGKWDISANVWIPIKTWHRIVCPGPFFCGMVRGMKQGYYLEIEGEMREQEQEHTVVVAGKRYPAKYGTYAVHATRITRLEAPDSVLIDFGEDG